jgi:hypothetical protein
MMLRWRFSVLVDGLFERYVALATIATATASLADVIVTGILGAVGADARGLLFADTARKGH